MTNALCLHDPAQCLCGFDICTCQCAKCQSWRDTELRLQRVIELEDRLKAMDIHPEDIAYSIYLHLEPIFKARIADAIHQLAADQIQRLLRSPDLGDQLAELLFDDIVEIAFGVHQGVKTNGGNKSRTRSTRGSGEETRTSENQEGGDRRKGG